MNLSIPGAVSGEKMCSQLHPLSSQMQWALVGPVGLGAAKAALVGLAGDDLLGLVDDQRLEGVERGEIPARAGGVARFAGGLERVEHPLILGVLADRGARALRITPGITGGVRPGFAGAARGEEGSRGGDGREAEEPGGHGQRPFRKMADSVSALMNGRTTRPLAMKPRVSSSR